MRAAALLLVAVAGLTGCATVAEGATVVDTESAPSAPSSPSLDPSPLGHPRRVRRPLRLPRPRRPIRAPLPISHPRSSAVRLGHPERRRAGPAPSGSFVLGDSISLSVAPLLSRYGYPVTGRVGQSAHAAFLQQHLSRPDAQAAPGWVIVLGTNNRGDEADVARLSEWIDLVADLRTRGAKQQVFWVTPHRPEAYAGGMSRWSLRDFNDELGRLASEHRWLHVVDFDAQATAHPEWFAQDAARLHPNSDGQAALAALIAGPDATPAARPAPITTLDWPTPTPTPSPTPELGAEQTFDNSAG